MNLRDLYPTGSLSNPTFIAADSIHFYIVNIEFHSGQYDVLVCTDQNRYLSPAIIAADFFSCFSGQGSYRPSLHTYYCFGLETKCSKRFY